MTKPGPKPVLPLTDSELRAAEILLDGEQNKALRDEFGLTDAAVARTLDSPQVIIEVRARQQRILTQLAMLGIRRLRDILKNPAKSLSESRLQLEAAKVVFDRAGLQAGCGDDLAAGKRAEMTLEEIEQKLAEAKSRAANAAKVIDVAPNPPADNAQNDPQLADMLS